MLIYFLLFTIGVQKYGNIGSIPKFQDIILFSDRKEGGDDKDAANPIIGFSYYFKNIHCFL